MHASQLESPLGYKLHRSQALAVQKRASSYYYIRED